MAKFAVALSNDGNFSIHSEHGDRDGAVMEYDSFHRALMGDTTMIKGTVAVIDEQLDPIEGGKWKDTIVHPQSEPTPEPEPIPEVEPTSEPTSEVEGE